jgi:hypothetical protein
MRISLVKQILRAASGEGANQLLKGVRKGQTRGMTTTPEAAVCLVREHSNVELEALLPAQPERLLLGLAERLHDSAACADQDLGHLEEQLLRGGQELFRQMLEKSAQLKADQAPPLCQVCQNKLSRWKSGHWTSIQTRFGTIRLHRGARLLQTVPQVAFSSRRAAGHACPSHAITGGPRDGGPDGQQDARARSRASGGTFGGGKDFRGDAGAASPPERPARRAKAPNAGCANESA